MSWTRERDPGVMARASHCNNFRHRSLRSAGALNATSMRRRPVVPDIPMQLRLPNGEPARL